MSTTTCTRNCWIAAAILGLLIWIFSAGIGPLGWFAGLFLGLIATGLFGVFLVWLGCSGAEAADGERWQPGNTSGDSASGDKGQDADQRPRGVASKAAVGFMGSAEGEGARQVAPSGDAQAPSGNGRREGSDRTDIYGSKDGGKAAASKDDSAAAEPAKPSSTVSETKSETKTDVKADAKADTASDKKADAKDDAKSDTKAEEPKPAKAKADDGEAAGSSTPDDLKQIKGVGPKLEDLLHENGVTQFAQIAAWDDEKIDHFAELIGRMGGRIRSDDWVAQARVLAEGGDTEFSKRVEDGDVY